MTRSGCAPEEGEREICARISLVTRLGTILCKGPEGEDHVLPLSKVSCYRGEEYADFGLRAGTMMALILSGPTVRAARLVA